MASSTEAGWTPTVQQTTPEWITPDSSSNSNQSVADLPAGCIILGLNATIPWNHPDNLISQDVENVLERAKSAIIIPIMFLIGAPCNVLNMAVFFKQGLKERINMCLFALAVADLLVVTWGFVVSAERMYTQFLESDARYSRSYRYIIDKNILGLAGLQYGPPLLTAIISTERCVCVLFPLRAQRCVSTRTMAVAIAICVPTVVLLLFAVTSKYGTACFHEELTGITSWQATVYYKSELHKNALYYLDGIFYGFVIAVGCPVVVFISTTVTAIKLGQIVKWRKQASSSASTTAMSSKEVGLTKMLICLSVEFFVLSIPIFVALVIPMFLPALQGGRGYTNTFRMLNSMNQLCYITSSSINFFVYYGTGTRFRETLHSMIARKSPADRKALASKSGAGNRNRINSSSASADGVTQETDASSSSRSGTPSN